MKTGSKPLSRPKSDWIGPIYLDASALVKLYLPEPESDALDAALQGREDLVVSDLAVTEVVSALARRRREGEVSAQDLARLHRKILADLDAEIFRRAHLLPEVHRQAERLLMSIDTIALRAADALHLALALASKAASIVTFDRRMAEAATRLALSPLPPNKETVSHARGRTQAHENG